MLKHNIDILYPFSRSTFRSCYRSYLIRQSAEPAEMPIRIGGIEQRDDWSTR